MKSIMTITEWDKIQVFSLFSPGFSLRYGYIDVIDLAFFLPLSICKQPLYYIGLDQMLCDSSNFTHLTCPLHNWVFNDSSDFIHLMCPIPTGVS